MVNNDSHIKLSDLSVGYETGRQKRTVIPGINLQASRGNLIALVGANGSGKSTLLKTLAGLQPQIKGRILIDNKPLNHYNRHQLAEKLSFVGTHYDMHAMMRVHQVVSYGRYPYTNILGQLHYRDKLIITKAMHDTGIFHLRDAFISEISDGEKQRVLIARSLAQDTDIILLDEPTAFLDVKNKFEILHLLGRLAHEKQKIILFSSHDLQIVLGTADLLWFIDSKKIIQGLPEEMVLKNTINELFRHSEVYFDAENNEFRINRRHNFCVSLLGSGTLYKWTERALDRLHIKVDNKCSGPQIKIAQKDEEIVWTVEPNGDQHEFYALQDLIKYLYSYYNETKHLP
jgi:iron complex transport system ATP-binding protein